jgi:16S rRNA (guanine527-N7)-methyltransferase
MPGVGSLSDYERGLLAGLLIGEGHFGVDRGTPNVVLGMSARHETLLRHVQAPLPGARLWGPYDYRGRFFFRLVLRGRRLRQLLDVFDSPDLGQWCPHVGRRYAQMRNGFAGATQAAAPRGFTGNMSVPMFLVKHLVDRFGLEADQGETLAGLLSLLAESDAPTSVHDPARAVDVHLADSLVGLGVRALSDANTVADIGSGAGLPGLALAIALPNASFCLVESVAKKCSWLQTSAKRLGLENVRVACARAEELDEPPFDVVTARALAALPVLCEYAAPLLREGGALVAWKGAVGEEEEADGVHAAEVLGLQRVEVRAVEPYVGSERRTLHVFRKMQPTPEMYPRRAGMAAKRPLTASGIRRAR